MELVLRIDALPSHRLTTSRVTGAQQLSNEKQGNEPVPTNCRTKGKEDRRRKQVTLLRSFMGPADT
jgi:hypothetical protein